MRGDGEQRGVSFFVSVLEVETGIWIVKDVTIHHNQRFGRLPVQVVVAPDLDAAIFGYPYPGHAALQVFRDRRIGADYLVVHIYLIYGVTQGVFVNGPVADVDLLIPGSIGGRFCGRPASAGSQGRKGKEKDAFHDLHHLSSQSK